MNDIAASSAAAINHHHGLARAKANEAIEHAIEAGRLLLAVKCQLMHGEWVAWLRANVTVTPRQAQRYMAAADGKRLSRQRKSHTVSYLPEPGQRRHSMPSGRTWEQLAIPDLKGDLC